MVHAFDDKPCSTGCGTVVRFWQDRCRACAIEWRVEAFARCERLNKEPISVWDVRQERARLEAVTPYN